MAGEAVGPPLPAQSAGARASDILSLAKEVLAAIVMPMAELMANREAFSPAPGTRIDGDDGSVGGPDDTGFASVERTISHARAYVPRYRVYIDLARFGDTEAL
jgi:hypothetical protein